MLHIVIRSVGVYSYPEVGTAVDSPVDSSPGCTHQELGENVQQLIDGLNQKRKHDMEMMADFKKTAQIQVSSLTKTDGHLKI